MCKNDSSNHDRFPESSGCFSDSADREDARAQSACFFHEYCAPVLCCENNARLRERERWRIVQGTALKNRIAGHTV